MLLTLFLVLFWKGIAVDIHVLRATRAFGWVLCRPMNALMAARQLESWLPAEHWPKVNYLYAGMGQAFGKHSHSAISQAACPLVRNLGTGARIKWMQLRAAYEGVTSVDESELEYDTKMVKEINETGAEEGDPFPVDEKELPKVIVEVTDAVTWVDSQSATNS